MLKLNRKTISVFACAAIALSAPAFAAEKDIKVKGPSFKERSVDAAVKYGVKDGKYAGVYRVNPQAAKIKGFGYGKKATKKEIEFNDIDVRYDWQGLPDGKGTVAKGDELYNKHCVMCHGDFGAGGKGYPTLAGGDKSTLKNQLLDPENGDEPPVKTIGSYWPYASTLFWYVKTGMPFPHPMSLTNDEVYSIVAYLLSINEIKVGGEELDDDTVLDKKKLMTVVMPNVDGFYPDVNSKDGALNMKKFISNPSNYGTQTVRCMKNCPTGEVIHIKHKLDDGIRPPVSEKRDLPKKKANSGGNNKYAQLFENNCKSCHGNKAIAPVPGDKEAWAPRIKQGKKTLYEHALKGFQGMPPKGGTNLPDADIKGIVDYMIEKSK